MNASTCKAVLSAAGLVLLLAAGASGGARAEVIDLRLDLNTGTLFHDSPTFTHPIDPPGFVFADGRKEIEDVYFSPTLRFTPTVLNPTTPAPDSLSLSITFADAVTGAQQYLVVDAKGTGSPFPETFAIRFPGPATHGALGPGMFFYGPSGGVQSAGDGTVTTTLGTLIGAPAINAYRLPVRCSLGTSDCTTGPHFPNNQDLTDTNFAFGSLRVDFALTSFGGCSVSRPDCGGINLGGFGFGMLAGDLSILQTTAPVPEPATVWLMMLGLLLLGGASVRRRRPLVSLPGQTVLMRTRQ